MDNKKFYSYLKNATIGLIVILIYFILSNSQTIIFDLFNVDYNIMPTIIKVVYTIIWEIFSMSLIMLILNKTLSKDIQDIKINHKKYFSKYLKFWLIGLGIMMMSNLFINIFVNSGLPSNEETIRKLFDISPIYIFISSVIYAPIVEELVFRQSIRNIITNKYLFIFVSGLVFGGLHVIGGMNSLVELVYLIPYCTPGFIFAYILTDCDNVLVSSGLHFLHNGILISLQFFLLFFS